MKHEDRAYQQEIEDSVFDWWFEKQTNCIACSPGGTGKSFVMARIAKRLVKDYPGTRIINLAQDGKLLTQNSNELLRYWPQAPIGIYSSGLKRRDTKQPIIFAGIQSCYKRAREFGERHIIIVDECDLLSPTQETMYQRFYNELREVNPNLLMAGFTATPYRLKEGCLTNLDIWDGICIDLTKTERFNWFVEQGYLKPLVTKKPGTEIDITNVPMKGGDFSEKELQEVSDTDELNKAIVEECIKFGYSRKHWLVFASGIKHGHNLTRMFNARGISAVMLTGEDETFYRQEKEREFKEGKIRVLVNHGLYARGWDFKALDMLVFARATQSVSFWVQACLRGTRASPESENCLVLDFCGNIRRLGPVNSPIVPKTRRKGDANTGEAPLKACPECYSYVPIQAKTCPDCGYVFPPPKTINKTASTDSIMVSSEPQIEEFEVTGVRYQNKVSKKGNAYLQVSYSCFASSFREFIFFGSDSTFLIHKAETFWVFHGGNLPIPENVEEACERASKELRIPSLIRVDMNTKYKEVIGKEFE